MLSPADVTREPDFKLGKLQVSPAARRIEADGNVLLVEPRVMQVLILLSRRIGEVVTRDEIFREVWPGAIVGDDSLNRAIAGVRKALALQPDGPSLETIPRTGYRLNVDVPHGGSSAERAPTRLSRRTLLVSAAAGAAVAGAGIYFVGARDEEAVNDLIRRSERQLNDNEPSNHPTALLKQAVALSPENARANGLLAYALAMTGGYRQNDGRSMIEAEQAAQRAFAVDPREPNARLAMTFIQQSSMDLLETEQIFRSVLEEDTDNLQAMRQLWNLLQCVGRSREAQAVVERAMQIDPLVPGVHYPLAQFLWINGRAAEADRVIDRAIRFWPDHRFVRFAQFMILAFTGRARAALAMLDRKETRPQDFTADMVALWRESLPALDNPTPAAVARARDANVAATKAVPDRTRQSVMTLAAIGELDPAFELANAFFVVKDTPARNRALTTSNSWRFAPWLFVPPTAPLRADARFRPLADTIGLTEYWARTNVRPDYQRA